eukprot:jgi/Tetstr1/462537/TSEL_007526.t1
MMKRGERPLECDVTDANFAEFQKYECITSGEDFPPGGIHEHRRYWWEYFEALLPKEQRSSQRVQNVKPYLRDGPPTEWVNPYSDQQQQHPKWAKKLSDVKDMLLHAGCDAAHVEHVTTSDEPKYVSLGSHPSMENPELASFARAEVGS